MISGHLMKRNQDHEPQEQALEINEEETQKDSQGQAHLIEVVAVPKKKQPSKNKIYIKECVD